MRSSVDMGDSEDEAKASLSEEPIRDIIIWKEITAALSSIPGKHSADKASGHSGKDETARINVYSEREGM